jgi:hypothetical protein
MVAAILLMVVGCGDGSEDPAREAVEQLRAAVDASTRTPYEGVFMFKDFDAFGMSDLLQGSVDHSAGRANLSWRGPFSGDHLFTTVRLQGQDLWLTRGESPAGERWLHLESARLPADNVLAATSDGIDPFGVHHFGASIKAAKKTGDETYEGTLDLRSAAGWGWMGARELLLLGDLSAVPFKAKVDGRGRLLEVKVLNERKYVNILLRDFGLPVEVSAPRESTAAPDAAYQSLARSAD